VKCNKTHQAQAVGRGRAAPLMRGVMWQQSSGFLRYEIQPRRIYLGTDDFVQNPSVGCVCNQRYVSLGCAIQ